MGVKYARGNKITKCQPTLSAFLKQFILSRNLKFNLDMEILCSILSLDNKIRIVQRFENFVRFELQVGGLRVIKKK